MLTKFGEAQEIKIEDTASCISEVSPDVLEAFQKFATNLKKIAPKANDFLYFSAVMMHAAESSAINDDGTPKLNSKGEQVKVGWDTSGGTWKWETNDPLIRPTKNINGDIFPESELILAYKKWRQKPLCIDHKSSSVDHTRGFIVDTYYDRNLKRIIALCALDKANYPDLARKISTNMRSAVSMGTGVNQAICTEKGCHRVARSEADFCTHMKNKSGYGEINVGLNPIELSIVVNGADPKAHIKNILASANTLNAYVDSKMTKLADFKASLDFGNGDVGASGGSAITSVQVNSKDIESFRKDVEKAIQDFQQLQSSLTKEDEASPSNNEASNQSGSSVAMDEGAPTDSEMSLQSPQGARLASSVESLEDLRNLTATIETKLNQMKHSLNKLAITQTQEETMSTANKDLNKQGYFQGGGGVNEPTPGQVKYPKDPLNEHLRDKEDRQMVGQSPFPEVGPVDGMHPSPSSVDPSDELARKKMLARAEAEERTMKRNAIVALAQKALADRQAYIQGGGGVNEPTPGKPKYPKDPLSEKDRNDEDKQMNGKAPFPGVGKVDDLYPGDMKTKEMVGRASLRARFVKAADVDGKLNKSKSAWEVFLGDRLLLTASVNELSGGNVDMLYSDIATTGFGAKLIEQVKVKGAQTVSQNIKRAQAVPPPAPDSSAPAPDAEAPAPGALPVEDEGKSGDPKKHALELSEKVRDLSSDLVEAVRALTGEQAEMGAEVAPGGAGGVGSPVGGPAMADDKTSTASFGTSVLNNWRKDLNGVLTSAIKESIAELNDHGQELDMIVDMYDKGAVNDAKKDAINTIVEDALTEAKTSVADGFKLMTAFVKYARGTQAIVKRAELDTELQALAEGDEMDAKKDSHSADGLMDLVNDTNADLDAVKMMVDDNDHSDLEETGKEDDGLDALLEGMADDNMVVEVKTPQEAAEVGKANPQETVKVMASIDSRAGRAALRAKIAADATGKEDDGEIQDASKIKFSDMLHEADKLTDGQTQLDVKPSDNLGRVETLPEINKRMLEVAKMPPKVRKEAEAIQKLVSEGKLHPDHVEALIKEGLDKDAVAYWKHFYGEVDGGSEFASELVKEHTKAEIAEELNKFQIKMARAYELAYDMAERGLCHTDRTAVSAQVDEIMKFSDENFDSLKRVVARHQPLSKTAGRIPQVGFRDDETPSTKALVEVDDYTQLSGMLGVKKRMF